MKKFYFVFIVISISIFLTACQKQKDSSIQENLSNNYQNKQITSTYSVGTQIQKKEQRYGIVVADTIKTITSNSAGIITHLNCEPGMKISAGTMIAKIIPNENDPNIQNLHLQKKLLEQQLQNLESNYILTQQNFEFQKQTILAQAKNNQNVYEQENADLKKLQNSLQNFKNQQENLILDALKKVRTLGGNAKNLDIYYDIYDQRNDITTMNDEKFSQYLADVANLMTKTARYASGDVNYNTFIGLANTFRTSKSSFDNLKDTYTSAKNTYENQRDTLGTNLDLVDEQIQTIENNKQIQLNTLDSQKKSLLQNIASLENTLGGEEIYSDSDGIVKVKGVIQGNKISPGTMICQIIPSNTQSTKIQIFSPYPLKIGKRVEIYQGENFLGTGVIRYELPYKDPITQNYIYELPNSIGSLKEGERLIFMIDQDFSSQEIRIPLEYVIVKLDGHYVYRQVANDFIETPIKLGNIDGDFVQVISGLNLGETIGK